MHYFFLHYILKLNIDDKFVFKKLFEENLPLLISKYLSVPVEYRKNLKNNLGKSAEDIFNDSLVEIKDIFNIKINELQKNEVQEKISDLSVQKRYLASVKKDL